MFKKLGIVFTVIALISIWGCSGDLTNSLPLDNQINKHKIFVNQQLNERIWVIDVNAETATIVFRRDDTDYCGTIATTALDRLFAGDKRWFCHSYAEPLEGSTPSDNWMCDVNLGAMPRVIVYRKIT
jgi:hypothetical protein